MPYITASIILQLLAVVIPRLETLRQEGQSGQAKITQYTRYLTIGLAILQSTGHHRAGQVGQPDPRLHHSSSLIPNPSVFTISTMVICMTAGTAVIMWLGELITDRGVGNGMSLMIFTQVIAVIPGEMLADLPGQARVRVRRRAAGRRRRSSRSWRSWNRPSGGSRSSTPSGWWAAGCTAGPRPISRSRSTRRASSRSSSPRRCCTSRSSPPSCSAGANAHTQGLGAAGCQANLVTGDNPVYAALFFVLIVFFTYFYVSITFNPTEVADNMKKYGGFIPGIRPGRPDGRVPELRAQPADRRRARCTWASSR